MRNVGYGLAALLALAGCEEEPAASAEPPTPSVVVAPEGGDEEPAPRSSWPDEVRPLDEAVASFESVDACLAELRARTPTAVAEGIGDLSYDAFFDDVCRGLRAVRDGDVEACDALGVSTARAGCRRRLAMIQRRPDACPEGRWGRDPVCVAWAARDRALCAAGSTPDRARCRAVLDGDARACRRLRPQDRVRCDAEIRRYAGALEGDREDSEAPGGPVALRAEVTIGDDVVTIDRGGAVARGLRLEPSGCHYRVAFDGPDDPGRRLGEATFSLALVLPATGAERVPVGATDAVLEVDLGERGTYSSIGGADGAVIVEAFEPRRGGALRGRLRATLRREGVEAEVEGTFRTWVRDFDPVADVCGS